MRLNRAKSPAIARTLFGDEAREASPVRMRFGVAAAVVPARYLPWLRCSQWPRWPARGFSDGSSDGGGQYGNLKAYVPDTLLSAIRRTRSSRST